MNSYKPVGIFVHMNYLIVVALILCSDVVLASGNEAIPSILAVIGSEILPALLILGTQVFAGRRFSPFVVYVLVLVCSWGALIIFSGSSTQVANGPISEVFIIFGALIAVPWIVFLLLAIYCAKAKAKEDLRQSQQ